MSTGGKNIEFKHNKGVLIDPSTLVKVKDMGNQIELCHIRSVPLELPIERISDTHYRVKSTKKIKEFNKSVTRDQQLKSVQRTFKNLRELINTNFTGSPTEKFITLTYAKHQRDTKEVYKDFQAFIRQVRKHYGNCEYINILEPQATGSWHCHILLKFEKLTYLDYNYVRELWGKGSFVNIQSLEGNTNIGLYLSAYLSDIEATDTTIEQVLANQQPLEVVEKDVQGQTKRFIKGGRLHYYPKGTNIYRCSRGIKKPTVYYSQKDTVDLEKYNFQHSNKIDVIQKGKVVNHIHYEQYSKK